MARKPAAWAIVAGCCWLAASGCAEKKKAPEPKAPAPVADYVVSLADHNLAAAVWQALGKTSGELHRSELERLTVLDLGRKEIISVVGIENFPNLKRLDLSGNFLRELTPLSGLSTLVSLKLDRNYLVDISPLGPLVNLTELDLADNEISDISPLAGMTRMVKLNLANNRISDLTPLAGMTKLMEVDLGNNRFTNIGALRRISNAGGLGPGAQVDLTRNSLDSQSVLNHIPFLKSNGAVVRY